ncbi:MAG: VRR-NUC domain-containing protein [Bacteroidales bacterium]|nr:VRR-NUC domain-containing protein [Bacteroidales bacterium]
MQHLESQLQRNCFSYFRYKYPKLARLFFAVPNGGFRNAREAGIMKAEGVTKGVADTILLVPNRDFHGLCIEFKTETGRQSPHQKTWQAEVEAQGYKYEIIKNLDTFIAVIENYLSLRQETLK